MKEIIGSLRRRMGSGDKEKIRNLQVVGHRAKPECRPIIPAIDQLIQAIMKIYAIDIVLEHFKEAGLI